MKHGGTGCEFAELLLGPDRLTARGVAIGSSPVPYRLDYVLETGAALVTTLLDVSSRGAEWSRRLLLRSDGAGSWTVDTESEGNVELAGPGGDPLALDGDLGLSPVTNLMPILRLGLASGEVRVKLRAAWVSVADLRVQPDGRRYTARGPNLIRYEALDGGFSATITVDDDGLVVDYPGIARRI
ncbi:MAG: putative glycolipid-binding domain-containing protein [Candidatus Dormibacteraceae bacterium]